MLHSKEIKDVLSQVPAGTVMRPKDIQNLVGSKCHLTKEDWDLHTYTRPTTYPKWVNKIQEVLSEYKRKGIVKHNPIMHKYTF